jgi:hypothetical protein
MEHPRVDDESLISRAELTAILFTIHDIGVEVRRIREHLEGGDGEVPES